MNARLQAALDLGMSAIVYVVERPTLLSSFMGATGLRAEDLRGIADSPELRLHALDFLLQDDAQVLDAAEALDVRPEDLMAARTAIAGPGSYGWEVG